jgi:hypothetical protein
MALHVKRTTGTKPVSRGGSLGYVKQGGNVCLMLVWLPAIEPLWLPVQYPPAAHHVCLWVKHRCLIEP